MEALTLWSPDAPVGCWSCGAVSLLDARGLCRATCAAIDPHAVPDMSDQHWPGHTGHGLSTSDVMVAAPNVRRVR